MSKKYYVTIGLEVHAELSTKSKMWCGCRNNPFADEPNVNICPICTAHPGALPVPNKQAIESVIKFGLAINGDIADFSEFDRKNYFYPDIPKGYQISQYKYPIVSGGHLADFDITRVHLEEDTGTNKHKGDYSLVDYNRAGVPLMELVTEPHTFESAEEAGREALRFAKELQLLLWYLEVSHANMEKGEMRVEANISVSEDKDNYGTKVEIKNLNSFKSVERGIKYEVDRMVALIEEGKGEEIVQETRGWDEAKQKTFSQRKKESSHDYRYFPDPDLPKMYLHEAFDLKKMKEELPELPWEKRERYRKDYGIKDEDIESYVADIELARWFEELAKDLGKKDNIKIASNYITSDYLGLKKNNPEINLPSTPNFKELIELVSENKISSRGAKDILAIIVEKDGSPAEIAEREGLIQKNDPEALKKIAEKVIAENSEAVESYKSGKENALMALVGGIMKETKGSANPKLAKEVLLDMLK